MALGMVVCLECVVKAECSACSVQHLDGLVGFNGANVVCIVVRPCQAGVGVCVGCVCGLWYAKCFYLLFVFVLQ